MSYTRRDKLEQVQLKSGWVYLGEFDISSEKWKTRYWNISPKTKPDSLMNQNIQVTAEAINVRNSGDPWAHILGALDRNTKVFVEQIVEWGDTCYYWAQVTY